MPLQPNAIIQGVCLGHQKQEPRLVDTTSVVVQISLQQGGCVFSKQGTKLVIEPFLVLDSDYYFIFHNFNLKIKSKQIALLTHS